MSSTTGVTCVSEHLSSPPPGFSGVRFAHWLFLSVVLCRSFNMYYVLNILLVFVLPNRTSKKQLIITVMVLACFPFKLLSWEPLV
jgi:hypothetical protein